MKFYTSVHAMGDTILVREYVDGKRNQYKTTYKPYLFVPSKKIDSPYKTLDDKIVDKLEFSSISEAKEFMNKYKDVEGFKLYGMTNFIYPFINDEYPGEIVFDPSLISILYADIEVASDGGFPDIKTANREITAITLVSNKFKNKLVLGCGNFTPKDSLIKYYKCTDEIELLNKFLEAIKMMDPDIWTGWNVDFFDLPYLFNRITRLMGPKAASRMSPWGIVNKRNVEVFTNKFNETVDLVGSLILDGLQLYRKFAVSMQPDSYKESLKLDEVAYHELKIKKVDYSEHGSKGSAAGLSGLYRNDYQKFIEYNIQDVDIVKLLDDKLKFIEQTLTIAYDGKVNYPDAFTSVKLWDVIIHNYLLNKNIVIPFFKPEKKDHNIEGAYVKEPQLGLHKWIVSFDLTSLYPMLIQQYNLSPECLVGRIDKYTNKGNIITDSVKMFLEGDLDTFGIRDDLIKNNQTIVPTGCIFSREKRGFGPELMEKMFSQRDIYKKEMLKKQQIKEDIENEMKKRGIQI